MTAPTVSIDQALCDPQLLGAALGDPAPWALWFTVLKAAFGIELNREERRAFAIVAGSRQPPQERVAELWAIVGRRSGKSRMAAALAVFLALFVDHTGKLAPGEVGMVLVLAMTTKQARAVFGYALAFLQMSPILAQQIESITADEIRLKGNIVIATHPNSFRSVRSRTLLACIFDESAFWRDEASATPDVETYRAVLPALASTGGMLVGISSPYMKRGLLAERHGDHFGQDGDILVIQADSRTMNPTLDERVIERARANDPEAALAEWDGMFRRDIAALLDDAVIDGAIDHSRPLELPPKPGVKYFAFADASAGRHDAFTLCIGHADSESFVADVLRAHRPPFDPGAVAAEYAALAKDYGCHAVTGDAFAGEWVAGAFRDAGVSYMTSPLPKSGLYLEALPWFNRGAVRIPDMPPLLRELRLLERRTHRSGKDSVDHPRAGSDDLANALCGALYLAAGAGSRCEVTVGVFNSLYDGVVHNLEQTPRPRLRIVRVNEAGQEITPAQARELRHGPRLQLVERQ